MKWKTVSLPILAATLQIACGDLTSSEPADPVGEVGHLQQWLVPPDPSSPEEGDANSPRMLELGYASRIGLLDGTNCDSWPKDLQIHGEFFHAGAGVRHIGQGAERVPPLDEQIDAQARSAPQAVAFDRALLDAIDRAGVSTQTLIGSKYRFEIDKVELDGAKVFAALDPETLTGYAISRDWLCTEAMVRRDQCTTYHYRPGHGMVARDGEAGQSPRAAGDYLILARSQRYALSAEESQRERPLLSIVAPEISIASDVVFQTDTLLVTDSLTPRGPIAVEPLIHHGSLLEAIQYAPQAPIFAVIADTLAPMKLNALPGGGADYVALTLDPRDRGMPARRTDSSTLSTQGNVARVPVTEIFSAALADDIDTGTLKLKYGFGRLCWGDDDDDRICDAFYRVTKHLEKTFARVITLTTAVSRLPGGDPAEVFVACNTGAGCSQGRLDASVAINRGRGAFKTADNLAVFQKFVGGAIAQLVDPDFDTAHVTGPSQNDAHYTRCIDGRLGNWCRGAASEVVDRGRVVQQVACFPSYDWDACARSAEGHPLWKDTFVKHYRQIGLFHDGPLRGSTTLFDHYREGDAALAERYAEQLWDQIFREPTEGEIHTLTQDRPRVEVGRPTLARAQIFARGALVDLLTQRAHNRSLRQGAPTDEWATLSKRLEIELLDHNPSGMQPLVDQEEAAQLYALRKSVSDLVQRMTIVAAGNEGTEGTKLNTLGLPYGRHGSGWALPRSLLTGQPMFLGDLIQSWQLIGQEMDRLTRFIETRRFAASQHDHLAQGRDLARAIASTAADHQALLQQRQQSLADYNDRLQELTDAISDSQQAYTDSIGTIWDCDASLPEDAPESCMQKMASFADLFRQHCQETGLFTILSDLASVVSFIDAAFEVIDVVSSVVNVLASLDLRPGLEFINDVQRVLGKVVKMRSYISKSKKALAQIDKFAKKTLLKAEQSGCDPTGTALVHLRNHLTTITDLITTIEMFNIQLNQMSALMERVALDVAFYRRTEQLYEDVEARMTALAEHYDMLLSSGQDGPELNAELVRMACFAGQGGIRSLLADTFEATRALQSTAGVAEQPPFLSIPADPDYQGAVGGQGRVDPTEHGFLVSIWDPERFRTTLFSLQAPTPGHVSFIDALTDRFALSLRDEACRVHQQGSLPFGTSVLTVTLSGPTLDAFLGRAPGQGAGRLPFEITLDDLLAGAPPLGGDRLRVPGMSFAGRWLDAATPVVLDVQYRAHRSSGAVGGLTPPAGYQWAGPGLAAPQVVVMGDEACGGEQPPLLSDEEAVVQGNSHRLEMCAEPVFLDEPASDLLVSTASRQPELDVVNSWRAATCNQQLTAMQPPPLSGRPLLGQWTLTFNPQMAAAEATQSPMASNTMDPVVADRFARANQDVDALDVHFVIGSEILRAGATPGFTPY